MAQKTALEGTVAANYCKIYNRMRQRLEKRAILFYNILVCPVCGLMLSMAETPRALGGRGVRGRRKNHMGGVKHGIG